MIIFKNLLKSLKTKVGFFGTIIGIFLLSLPAYFFTWRDKSITILGMGEKYFYFILTLDIFLAILFGIFIGATLYKMSYFGNKKTSKIGFLGGFLGAVFGGCASCSVTLATYLGLASLLSFLPYNGVELKILSIALLFYATFITLKRLEVCQIKLKKR